jgi:hypothetical protein
VSRKGVLAGFFILHFSLIFLVSTRQVLFALAEGDTLLPRSWSPVLARLVGIATTALAENLAPENLIRRGIAAYTHSAGIDTGYAYFAPNVAISHKLVFEVKYADGRVEYDLPHVGREATGLRLVLLFDNIARIRYDVLRETLFRMMAYSIWLEHPDASVVRVVFGMINLPSVSDFEHGKAESYEVLYAYDFRFSPPAPPASP